MSHPSFSWTLLADSATPAANTALGVITPGVDFALDANGDLDLSHGDLRMTTGIEAVAQGIQVRLLAFRGEWFADLDDGVPYYEDLLGQKFNEAVARDAFRSAIAAAPGVLQVLTLSLSFHGPTRTLSLAFEAQTNLGVIAASLEA